VICVSSYGFTILASPAFAAKLPLDGEQITIGEGESIDNGEGELISFHTI
jgi:hypothetical protein